MGTLALPVPSASAQFHRHPSHQRSECRRACHQHPAGLQPLALKTGFSRVTHAQACTYARAVNDTTDKGVRGAGALQGAQPLHLPNDLPFQGMPFGEAPAVGLPISKSAWTSFREKHSCITGGSSPRPVGPEGAVGNRCGAAPYLSNGWYVRVAVDH